MRRPILRFLPLLTIVFYSLSAEGSSTLERRDSARHGLLIRTIDNVTIRGSLYDNTNTNVIIYCHRLLGSQRGKEAQLLVETFIEEYDLITFNFRGHRSSAWISTTGGDEILDLRAVISFARDQGYRNIVVLGAGMGGSVAMRATAIFGNIDALVVVSPSGFSPDLQPFWVDRASDIVLNTDFGKVPLRILTNTRLGPRYAAGYPLDYVAFVSPVPLLILQAQDDRFVDFNRIRSAFDRALEPKQFIVVPGSRHAEKLLEDDTLTQIKNWLKSVFIDKETPENSVNTKSLSPGHSDTCRIVIRGDLPIPEDVILSELRKRLSAPAEISQNRKLMTTSLLHHVKDVLSFHGYTRTSLTIADSLTFSTVSVAIPQVHSVSIAENRWITEEYIRNTLAIDGDYYNSYELDTALRRLAAEPAVRSATSHITDREDGNVDISVTVVEERPYRFILSTKFTDIDKFCGAGFTGAHALIL